MPALQRTSVTELVINTSASSGPPGAPTWTESVTDPIMFAGAPASGKPGVSAVDSCTGGLQDGWASGGPCVRFAEVHERYAGTSGVRIGVAPFGRTYWSATFTKVQVTVSPAATEMLEMGEPSEQVAESSRQLGGTEPSATE